MASNVEGKFQYLIETKELIKAAIQEKGQTVSDSTPFREYASKIQAIEQSVVSPDVCYVTFKNGSTTLYKKAVAVGDDCVDVLAKGLLTTTPTKASTAQYHYTYSGWSRTNGGAASDTALSSVTANRTVYAAFTSSVRSYTITYYDSDGTTVLKTETLAYGSTPNYVPSKDGYNFEGWTTAIATVTGDASYVSKWSSALTFAGASWADIARISESGEAANYFSVGDSKTITTTEGDSVTLRIAGFNQDTISGSEEKAGMTIFMYSTISKYCITQGDGKRFSTESGIMAYGKGEELYSAFPAELTSVVKTVDKLCHKVSNGTVTEETHSHTWFLPAEAEIDPGRNTYAPQFTLYDLFSKVTFGYRSSATDNRSAYVYNENGERVKEVALRSTDINHYQKSLNVSKTSNNAGSQLSGTNTYTTPIGVFIAFCI